MAGGRPAGFVWRGRRHRVRRVLEHWVRGTGVLEGRSGLRRAGRAV
ncbi:DUF6504 family protein [Thermomonospora sp. CIF 1]